jgi:hypothetical protein
METTSKTRVAGGPSDLVHFKEESISITIETDFFDFLEMA